MNRLILSSIVVLLMAACTHDNLDEIRTDAPSVESKLRNWNDNAAKDRLMVRLSEDVDIFEIEGIEIDVERLFPNAKGDRFSMWRLVRFDESLGVKAVAEHIAADSRVEIVEFDIPVKRIKSETLAYPTSRPEPTRSIEMPFNDPELPYQWHYYNDGSLSEYANDPSLCLAGADINLFNAWKYTAGDNRIIVGVMDGGVMTDHPDLADNMWVNEAEKNGVKGVDDDGNGYIDDIYGYNFVANSGNVTADSHGTHVAGTISAVNNNNYAVCGIAGGTGNSDGVRIMSLQIFEGDEGCSSSSIAKAFIYAADNGAVLVNNSWGYGAGGYISDSQFAYYDYALNNAIDYFESNAGLEGLIDGGLAIFAAGNETYAEAAYPGAYYKYICVSAMSSDYSATYYTNYGPGCNITAPGGNSIFGTMFCVSSTSTDLTYGYEYMQGTSMATPHVTGCAALALSYALKQGYTLTNKELRNLILTSTHDINQYQTGERYNYDFDNGEWFLFSLEPYVGNLGSGYIDVHRLFMQMDNVPCIYIDTNKQNRIPLDKYFGDGFKDITYYLDGSGILADGVEALGMTEYALSNDGYLVINCTKSGTCRIIISAIIGGESVGGGDNIGGMIVEREFELVARNAVASNGGWL